MKKENRRKLSLGDIIRKMNETSVPPPGDSEQPSSLPQPLPEVSQTVSPPVPAFEINPEKNRSFLSDSNHRRPEEKGKILSETIDTIPPQSPYTPPASVPPFRNYPQPAVASPENEKISSVPVISPLQQDDDEEEAFNVFRYIGIILHRKEIVILSAILFGLYSFYVYITSTKYYTATARLLFVPYQTDILDNSRVRYNADLEKSFNTHMELLRSNVVVDRVVKNLSYVSNAGKILGGLIIRRGMTGTEENNILELSLKNPDPEIARDALNELCKAYLEYNREVNAQEDTRLIFSIKNQIDKVQDELKIKEDALRTFKENNRMIELSSETNLVINKLSSMELALQQTQLNLLENRERMETIKSQINKQEVNVVQSMTFQNPMLGKLGELELELNTLSAEYSPDHYKVKQITQQIENLKLAMRSQVEKKFTDPAVQETMIKNPIRENFLQSFATISVDISALEAKRIAQEQLIKKLNATMQMLPALEQKYANLERETDAQEKTLKLLKVKLEEKKIQRDSKECELKIFELAKLPQHSIRSKKISSIFFGIIIGLLVGIILVFLIDFLDQSIKEPDDIEKILEIPLIGIIPLIDTENALVHNADLTKSVLEPFRSLRVNIKHIATQHNAKVFMICSAVKGEGKTTLATNIAITFALDGKKVIIIDCDLRRSHVHSLLNVTKENGLSEYLSDAISGGYDAIIKPTVHENLSVITSGERPSNPAELLDMPKFSLLLKELRSRVDFVICDSPALIPVSDSMIMLPHMDCYFLVIRARWTPLKAARQAKIQLGRINQSLAGAILNGISPQKGYYPYYYGYYGYYSYYSYKYAYEYNHEAKKPFSVRELGLRFDTRVKNIIQFVKVRSPHFLLKLQNLFIYLGKKWIFWLLFLGIAVILITRKMVENETSGSRKIGITYIDTKHNTSSPQHKPITVAPVQSIRTETLTSYKNNPTEADARLPRSDVSTGSLFAYQDSLRLWLKAFSTKDTARLFAFYDPDSFAFPDGRYVEWLTYLRLNLSDNTDRLNLSIPDSITGEHIRGHYFKTQLYTRTSLKNGESVSIIRTMIWRNAGNSWRITREKTIK